MNRNEVFADEKSIIGIWANYLLADIGVDESVIVFYSNGTGFIHYTQIDFEIVETFQWNGDGNYFTIKGFGLFHINKGILDKVDKSKLKVENIWIHLMRRESMQGSEIDAIQFTEFLNWTCDENDVFGLLNKSTDEGYHKYAERVRKVIGETLFNECGMPKT